VLGTGLLGAYTTFSTFSYETVRLLQEGAAAAAALNVAASLVLGLTAAATGLGLALLL
jgi:CrcB protein